jgi:hypothetical protein
MRLNLSIPCQIFLCLAIFITNSDASYHRHSFEYQTTFITPQQAEICKRERINAPLHDQCYVYAECILEYLTEYAKNGMNSGTTLLALMPAAIASLNTRRKSILNLVAEQHRPASRITSKLSSTLVLFIAAFGGVYAPGRALRQISQAADRANLGMGVDDAYAAISTMSPAENSEIPYVQSEHLKRPRWRIPTFIILIADIGVICWLFIQISFRTVVTWACNYDFLVVLWALFRTLPLLIEFAILTLLHHYLKRLHSGSVSTDEHAVPTPRWLQKWLTLLHILVQALDYALLLLGTDVLGSVIMMDGPVAIIYLLVMPFLYGLLHLGCFLLE